jgi:hypothetical protein
MFDVIDTEKYIGIVLEMAGGESIPQRQVLQLTIQVESCLIISSPVDISGRKMPKSSLLN